MWSPGFKIKVIYTHSRIHSVLLLVLKRIKNTWKTSSRSLCVWYTQNFFSATKLQYFFRCIFTFKISHSHYFLPNSARVHTSNFYPCVCVRCVCFWWYLIFHPFLVSLPPPSLSARRVPCRIALDIFYPNLPMALFFATALYVANKALSNIPMTVNTPPTIAHMDVTKW